MAEKVYFCVACGEEHHSRSFYVSDNPLHKNGRLPICKKAIKDYVATGADTISPKRLQSILRQMDLPYIHDVYLIAVEDERDTVGMYFSQINSQKYYKGLTWQDSKFDEIEVGDTIVPVNEDFYVTDEMVKRWGNVENDEYQFLESYYEDYMSRVDEQTPITESLVKHVCRAELNAFRISKDGDAKKYGDAVGVVRNLMKELNLSPSQQKDRTASEESFGKYIRQIENEEPIESWEEESSTAQEVLETAKFMIGHIGKMIGRDSPYDGEYNDIIEAHGADDGDG